TVMATVTWSHMPSSISQIGASAGDKSVVSGNVVVAILSDPYLEMSNTVKSMMNIVIVLIGAILGIAIPLIIMKTVLRSISKIF
ncbi:MAG: hypothetical protein GXO43_02115, partial [Crenarchaeota archaeon]|nr:hypothetical protein [Thermoproteota archaeon]